MNLEIAGVKLAALREILDKRLADPRARYLDPAVVLELFQRYGVVRDFLRGTYPERYDDVPVRETPTSSGTSDHQGRGYIERRHLELLKEDVGYCLALIPGLDPKLDLSQTPSPAKAKTRTKPPSIFLGHSSKDKFFVRKLAERLEAHDVRVWLDEAEINIGDSLTEKIGGAIQETDFFGVVLSTNSIESRWVQRELAAAMAKELAGPEVVVLPLLLEPVAIPPFLRDKAYADFTSPDGFEKTFKALLRTLGVSQETLNRSADIIAGIDAALANNAAEVLAKEKAFSMQESGTLSGQRLMTFEDVRMLELDTGRSHNPDPSRDLYDMYLRLSDAPPVEWQELFNAERSFPRHSMWRHAWIEGEYIVIRCVPNELERYHLTDLKQDVANSNLKYRQYLLEQTEIERRVRERGRRERETLNDLASRLDLGE